MGKDNIISLICILTDIELYREPATQACKVKFPNAIVKECRYVSSDRIRDFMSDLVNRYKEECICLLTDQMNVAEYLDCIQISSFNKEKPETPLPVMDVEFYEFSEAGLVPVMDEEGSLTDNYINKEYKKIHTLFYNVLDNYEDD